MTLEGVLARLYASEINCSLSSEWDGGWQVRLGDERNGFVAEGYGLRLDGVAVWLDGQARLHFPDSTYARGDAR